MWLDVQTGTNVAIEEKKRRATPRSNLALQSLYTHGLKYFHHLHLHSPFPDITTHYYHRGQDTTLTRFTTTATKPLHTGLLLPKTWPT